MLTIVFLHTKYCLMNTTPICFFWSMEEIIERKQASLYNKKLIEKLFYKSTKQLNFIALLNKSYSYCIVVSIIEGSKISKKLYWWDRKCKQEYNISQSLAYTFISKKLSSTIIVISSIQILYSIIDELYFLFLRQSIFFKKELASDTALNWRWANRNSGNHPYEFP